MTIIYNKSTTIYEYTLEPGRTTDLTPTIYDYLRLSTSIYQSPVEPQIWWAFELSNCGPYGRASCDTIWDLGSRFPISLQITNLHIGRDNHNPQQIYNNLRIYTGPIVSMRPGLGCDTNQDQGSQFPISIFTGLIYWLTIGSMMTIIYDKSTTIYEYTPEPGRTTDLTPTIYDYLRLSTSIYQSPVGPQIWHLQSTTIYDYLRVYTGARSDHRSDELSSSLTVAHMAGLVVTLFEIWEVDSLSHFKLLTYI